MLSPADARCDDPMAPATVVPRKTIEHVVLGCSERRVHVAHAGNRARSTTQHAHARRRLSPSTASMMSSSEIASGGFARPLQPRSRHARRLSDQPGTDEVTHLTCGRKRAGTCCSAATRLTLRRSLSVESARAMTARIA